MITSWVLMCDALAADADAVAGGRLAGDGEERVVDVQGGLQRDEPGHAEDDGPRALRLDRLPEAARPAVVQVGDDEDGPATPAGRLRPRPLGARERRDARRRPPPPRATERRRQVVSSSASARPQALVVRRDLYSFMIHRDSVKIGCRPPACAEPVPRAGFTTPYQGDVVVTVLGFQ